MDTPTKGGTGSLLTLSNNSSHNSSHPPSLDVKFPQLNATLSAKMGGLNLLDPTSTNSTNYTTSRRHTAYIIDALKGNINFITDMCYTDYQSVRDVIAKKTLTLYSKTLPLINSEQRAVNRAKDEKISSWLTVAPIAKHHFVLSA